MLSLAGSENETGKGAVRLHLGLCLRRKEPEEEQPLPGTCPGLYSSSPGGMRN